MLPRSQHAAPFGRHPGMGLVLIISAGLFIFGLVALMLAGGAHLAGRRIPFAERIAGFVVGAERAPSEFAAVPRRPKRYPHVPRRRRR